MLSTGIVRKIGEFGRFALPKELRKSLNIDIKDPLAIYVDGANIILKKYEPDCVFCGDARDVSDYKGKNICKDCMNEFKK